MNPRSPVAAEPWSVRLGGEGLALLAQSVLALRSTADLGIAVAIAGDCAVHALEAADFRLLSVDPRSGALRVFEAAGVRMPYLAEPGGAIEWVLRQEKPLFDDGLAPDAPARESLLWTRPPRAMATVPLQSRSTAYGLLLVAFDQPHRFASDQRLFLQTLGDALALLLEREELRRQLDEARSRSIELEARLSSDEETAAGLVTAVAQEMQAPVSSIQAYAEGLSGALDNPVAQRERFVATIEDESRRLARLLQDILELARIELGARPLHVLPVDLAEVWTEAAATLRRAAERRQVRLELQIATPLTAEADPDLMRQLAVNLTDHAVRHAPEGTRVRVAARLEGEEWTGEVSDSGPGVAPGQLDHVFDRFSRVRLSPDGRHDGAGLGLAIARGIVELHGGRIGADSEPTGGCRLHFRLPRRQAASPRARRVARQVLERPELRQLLAATAETVSAMMDAEITSLMMVDPEHGDLVVTESVGLDEPESAGRRVPLRAGVAGTVAAMGQAVRVENIETDRRFRRLNHPQYSTKSLLCVPLRVEGEVLGVVNVSNKKSRDPFSEDDLAVLAALVERVGGVIERAYAYPDGGVTVEEALSALRSLTAMRRERGLGGPRIVRWTRAVAQALRLSPGEVDLLGYVASIHDVGMTRIESLLLPETPERIDTEFHHALMQHPEAGVEVLRPLEYQGAVRDVILAHHEWWDGSGYPRGLRAEEIPLGARILAVVDAYESMTAGRPHRAAVSREEALAELRRQSGRQFDPDVVEALTAVLERERSSW